MNRGAKGNIVQVDGRLNDWMPKYPLFVAIDSDGSVFDSMDIKQKKCFHPLIERHWRLGRVSKQLRECAEFAGLHSKWRGSNRFICLLVLMDLLRDRPAVAKAGVNLPSLESLRRFVDSGVPLGNAELKKAVDQSGDKELASVLKWSRAVDVRIARVAGRTRLFRQAVQCLELLGEGADLMVVSQTPTATLAREWSESGITGLVRKIAGQEYGSKSEQVRKAISGRYAPENALVIGDAPGDLKAALDNGVHFYPIQPGVENASWRRFHDEVARMFLDGRYAGKFEQECIDRFNAALPAVPPWQRTGPQDKPAKGYVHIYTGDGKGKTTAAVGLIVRAVASGLRVYVCQFAKSRDSGEISMLRERFPEVEVDRFGVEGFVRGAPSTAQKAVTAAGLRKLAGALRNGSHDLVVADELCTAVSLGLCDLSNVISLVESRPASVELVLTGRDCHPKLVKLGDLVTKMTKVRHYYDHGVKARKGIEW